MDSSQRLGRDGRLVDAFKGICAGPAQGMLLSLTVDVLMRIPSGLNDGNLYRRDEKSQQQTQYRRLLRLILAFVLILVVMKQAGEPTIYRIFFSEPQNPSLLSTPPAKESLSDSADSADPADSPQGNGAATAAREQVAQEQAAQEQTDLANVDDGATWKPRDSPAFYRLLEGTPLRSMAANMPRRVGVISLLQQPEVYLRTRVSLSANVARVSRLDAKVNDYGITDYWEIWLQPLDGSNRPVAFYTRHVPEHVSQLVGAEYVSDGPAVEVEGVYLKRLAYRSAAGSELAPAIIGRIESPPPIPAALLPVRVAPSRPSLGLLVLAAAVLGIGAAITITMVTAASSRRTRQARLAGQHASQQLFTSLASDLESREQP